MKTTTLLLGLMLAIAFSGCNNKTENSSASKPATSQAVEASTQSQQQSQETIDQLNKAVTEEHANPDATYSYDASTNTVTMAKEIELTDAQAEEDFDVATEYNKFVEEFKKSNKASDATIKTKGATITVKYVNKATGEDFMSFDITPEDLK